MSEEIFRFNLKEIQKSFDEVQRNFTKINAQIKIKRDDFDDFVKENMMLAYNHVDYMLEKKIEVFSPYGYSQMLELNHIVLCGDDNKIRKEYSKHIEATREKFNENIVYVKSWYKKHDEDSSKKIAAEIYVAILTQPQLFIEGNHRTGSLIASWILMQSRKPPFVLNTDNAVAFFNPSAEIKMSDRTNKYKLPKYRSQFKDFLNRYIDERYLIRVKK